MIDSLSEPCPQHTLDTACARAPRSFALATGAVAACAVSVFAATMPVALWMAASAVHALVAGEGSVWSVLLKLVLAGYLLVTGSKALRALPAGPQGPVLTEENAPRLFHLLGKIAGKTGVAVPREVVLGDQMQVSVSLLARFGLLGWHRPVLVVGLPALMALDVKHLAAAITHALAHDQAPGHPLCAWLCRMRGTWARLALAQPGASTPARRAWRLATEGLAGLFLRRVFPWIDRRAMALSRHWAFSADKVACRVAGTQSLADALVRLAVQRAYLDELFWPEVFNRVSRAPTPNVLPYRAMGQRMRVGRQHVKAAAWLALALQTEVQATDTHPRLRERLARTKLQARLVQPPQHSAAELLLRESLDPLMVQMDIRWQLDMAPRWGGLHVEHLAQHRLEKELQVDGEKGALHPDDHMLWALAARSVQGDAAFEALLRLMLIDHPGDACARHALGGLLIDRDDVAQAAEGARLLRQLALEQTCAQSLPAARRYGQWLALQEGPLEDLDFWGDEIRRVAHLAQEAQCAMLDFDDAAQSFAAPALSARMSRRIGEALAGEPSILQAHLATKKLVDFPTWRFAVLLVRRAPRRRWAAHEPLHALQGRLDALGLPLAVRVVDDAEPGWATPQRQALAERIRAASGAPLLDRAEPSSAVPVSSASSSRYMPA